MKKQEIKLVFSREIIIFLIILLIASLLAARPQVEALMNGQVITASNASEDPGFRLIREAMLVVICVYMLAWLKRLPKPNYLALTIVFTICAYLIIQISTMLLRGYPIVVPLSGLRIFQYLPILFAGFVLGLHNEYRAFDRFLTFLVFFVLIQATLSIYQIFTLPPVFGTTFFGSRPIGTFSSPNILGMTFVACALLFAFSKEKKLTFWMVTSVILACLTGSRSAFIGGALVAGYHIWKNFSQKLKFISLPSIPLIGFLLYFFATSKAISGRTINNEERLNVWESILDNVNTGKEFLFGWGMGLGSNTISTLFGYNSFEGQYVSDSTFIFLMGSFGIVGVIMYALAFIATWFYAPNKYTFAFLVVLFFYSNIFIVWETFPSNVLFMLLWGWILGQVKYYKNQNLLLTQTKSKKKLPSVKSV